MPDRKRLHITPLNSQLLPIVLQQSTLQQASSISFHTIQTFPEKGYGYIDLPDVEADKLKKKLHGSVLRGCKMRVEEARPKKARGGLDENKRSGSEEVKSVTKRSKRAKVREEGVIPGYELQDRKVKRGWTEPASAEDRSWKRSKRKAREKSKAKTSSITGEAECLFRTKLPPNRTATGDSRVNKRKRSNRDAVVHEFENTTKQASFLKDGALTKSKQDGNEEDRPEKLKSRSRRSSELKPPSVKSTASNSRGRNVGSIGSVAVDDETSSSDTSTNSDRDGESNASEAALSLPLKAEKTKARGPKQRADWRNTTKIGFDGAGVGSVETLSITRSSASPPPTQVPVPASAPANEVHPLEALFKRPNSAASRTIKKPALEVSTCFNFSDADADEGGSRGLLMPQTPFTKQDIRQRSQRSAAPTPDTAAPGKTFGSMWEGTSDISDHEDDVKMEDTPPGKAKEKDSDAKEEQPESEFSKWFWEHRGETNRAWKRRRREAAKEKRQRDNKERRG